MKETLSTKTTLLYSLLIILIISPACFASDIASCINKQRLSFSKFYLTRALGIEHSAITHIIIAPNHTQEDYIEAEKICKQGGRKDIETAAACFAIGLVHEKNKKQGKAIDLYSKTCKDYHYPPACLQLDRLTKQNNNLPKAIKSLEQKCNNTEPLTCYTIDSFKECHNNDTDEISKTLYKRLKSSKGDWRDIYLTKARFYFYEKARYNDPSEIKRVNTLFLAHKAARDKLRSTTGKVLSTSEQVRTAAKELSASADKLGQITNELKVLTASKDYSKKQYQRVLKKEQESKTQQTIMKQQREKLNEMSSSLNKLSQEQTKNKQLTDNKFGQMYHIMQKALKELRDSNKYPEVPFKVILGE